MTSSARDRRRASSPAGPSRAPASTAARPPRPEGHLDGRGASLLPVEGLEDVALGELRHGFLPVVIMARQREPAGPEGRPDEGREKCPPHDLLPRFPACFPPTKCYDD